ncbi:sensor histidine kinase [Hymenobacter oligotrophus]|uniref:Sensor histidine kinase n=1 Tax=Hymenobacter oligotrophus TaxID=2319843 RepID=A0A3B7QVG9_9BACT|nr:sensor histidine kinase [Hymenobacter oligotrophus]
MVSTGLSLFVTKQIEQLHQGKIRPKSIGGAGTCLVVGLP